MDVEPCGRRRLAGLAAAEGPRTWPRMRTIAAVGFCDFGSASLPGRLGGVTPTGASEAPLPVLPDPLPVPGVLVDPPVVPFWLLLPALPWEPLPPPALPPAAPPWPRLSLLVPFWVPVPLFPCAPWLLALGGTEGVTGVTAWGSGWVFTALPLLPPPPPQAARALQTIRAMRLRVSGWRRSAREVERTARGVGRDAPASSQPPAPDEPAADSG